MKNQATNAEGHSAFLYRSEIDETPLKTFFSHHHIKKLISLVAKLVHQQLAQVN
jgi:hypothetical protein